MVKLRFHTDVVGRRREILQTLGDQNRISGSPFHKRWAIAGVTLIILFFSAVSGEAGMVYGRISKEGGFILANRTFVLMDENRKNSVNVQTDRQGNYSIMIPPGVYRVRFTDEAGEWEAQVRSYPNASQQDIQLRRRR